ncbi:uncharacterized protein SCHCODRAFT_02664171 [Schizophyllum commune H4-8]|nr:uncharacterized protein SCHCODRAFT_02664171 [Schizophyllum commune H4-8]KAI5896351.1 hypothetical protein SCHCODRAFT_02664171 [Schizophyllum commune H4-8]
MRIWGKSQEPLNVAVVIVGRPESGKKSLAKALDGSIYHRSHDNQSFLFDVEIHDGSSPSTKSSNLPFMALITLAYSQRTRDEHFAELIGVAASVSSSHCFVLTKVDLVPPGANEERINCLRKRAAIAWSCASAAFSASSLTHEGLDELRGYIVFPTCRDLRHSQLVVSVLFVCAGLCGNVLFSPSFYNEQQCMALVMHHREKSADYAQVDEELATIHDDDALNQLRKLSTAKPWNQHIQRVLGASEPGLLPVKQITDSLVVKWPTSSERACLEYIRNHTTIPVPRVYRPDLSSLVMDLVEGENLLECWNKQSRFMQFRIACTLRLYVKQLRSLTSSRLGGPENGRVSGLLFRDQAYGPFRSTLQFRRFCEYVVAVSWDDLDARKCASGAPLPPIPQCKGSWDPVFVHGDLNPSNLILDKRNTLWIVDWATAGFYPAFMESQTMRYFNEYVWRDDFDKIPRSWRQYREFIAGKTDAESDRFWDYFEYTVYRFGGDPYV